MALRTCPETDVVTTTSPGRSQPITYMRRFAAAVVCLLAASPLVAQDPASADSSGGLSQALRVFFDCRGRSCDFDFYRREVPFVNYTRGELPDELLEEVAGAGATLGITYMPYGDAYRMRGTDRVPYRVDAILEFLAPRVDRARAAGVAQVIVDPNLGILHPATDDHAKAHLQLEVLANVDRIRELGCPVLLYAARKPERLARILFAEAVLRARPEYVRTHDPDTIARLLEAARETSE